MAEPVEFETQKIGETDFQVLKLLGQGTYGQVLMARELKTGQIIALKVMMKAQTKLQSFLHELCVSTFLSSYKGIIFTYPSFRDSLDYYVLTQELAPAGSLHSLIQDGVGIPEVMVKRCALQLTAALEYMHSRALVHRDLKPDNVLLMDEECHHIKLSDFGLAQITGTLVSSMRPIIPYMSPELCELKRKDTIVLDPSVDIWALGVLLYLAFTGYVPWERAMKGDELFQRFIYWQRFGDRVPPPSNWTKLSNKAQDLFHILLCHDPKVRKPLSAVLNHLDFPWGVEDISEEVVEIVIEDDHEMDGYESQIIVFEGEDEFIVVENVGDIECIILCDTTDQSVSGSSNSIVVFCTENTNLTVGSEVEI